MPVKLSYHNSSLVQNPLAFDLLQTGEHALVSMHPEIVIPELITVEHDTVVRVISEDKTRYRHFSFRRLHLLAVGKAAPWMASSCRHIVGYADTAVIAGPSGAAGAIAGWTWLHGDHPIPGWNSMAAARYIRRMTGKVSRDDLFIVLLTGGASSIMSLPGRGFDLPSTALHIRELMHDGATIHELNAYRRSVDQLKAGGLARLVSPGQVINLMVSDVPGDVLEDIGSGPTIPFRDHIARRDDERFGKDRWSYPYPVNIIAARNIDAQNHCLEFLRSRGYGTKLSNNPIMGEARIAGKLLARYARMLRAGNCRNTCILFGGETTVTVRGEGRGGRNLELAASFAASISGMKGVYLLTLATDGKDGSSPSCGALVHGSTLKSAGFSIQDVSQYLNNNDSYSLLSACGSTLYSGATGTNVMDLAILAIR